MAWVQSILREVLTKRCNILREDFGEYLGTREYANGEMMGNVEVQGKTWTRQDTLYCVE